MNHAETHTATIDQQVGPRGRFSLRQAAGEIRIRGVEGDRIRVRSRDDENLDDLFHISIGSNFVELRQIEKLGIGLGRGGFSFNRGSSPEIDVEVPHGADVTIDSASAEVSASDLSGSKHVRTASGDLTFDRLAGPLEVESVSGDIVVDGQAPIEIAGKSISGDIRVRVPRMRRLELQTTSGDVFLDAQLDGNGPFSLRSISGDVTIIGRSGMRIEAQTVTGDLNSDLPSKRESSPGRKILVVGRPGPTLSFQSVSGDLHIAEPRDAAPETVPSPPLAPEPPAPPAVRTPGSAPMAPAADIESARLDILRALERGDISVAEATEQLGRLDEVSA
jgi:DUF4097 and DUF4098 domain-containing protein YvlB